jgi:hypothetical protein
LVAQPCNIQKNWRPIETAQIFSMAHPKSLQPTLAVKLLYDRSLIKKKIFIHVKFSKQAKLFLSV